MLQRSTVASLETTLRPDLLVALPDLPWGTTRPLRVQAVTAVVKVALTEDSGRSPRPARTLTTDLGDTSLEKGWEVEVKKYYKNANEQSQGSERLIVDCCAFLRLAGPNLVAFCHL